MGYSLSLPEKAVSGEEALKEAQRSYDSVKHQWVNSQCRYQLLQRIDDVRPHQGWQITEAFALGLGELVYLGPETLSYLNRSPDEKKQRLDRRMSQLAAFIDIVHHGRLPRICVMKQS